MELKPGGDVYKLFETHVTDDCKNSRHILMLDVMLRYWVQGHYKGDVPAGQISTHGLSRFWWRCKEVLDAAHALEAGISAAPTAEYIIFLQDDVVVAPGLLPDLKMFTAQQAALNKSVDVVTLFTLTAAPQPVQVPDPSSNHWGMVGVVFRRAVVVELIPFLRARFSEIPVDWLLCAFISSRSLNFYHFHPNLVQHVGNSSSLKGKRQVMRASTFRDRRCWVG